MTGTRYRIFFLLFLVCLSTLTVKAGDTLSNSRKQKLLFTTAAIGYVAGMGGLYKLWYADYNQSSFHFFDDNKGWLQVDKTGHSYTAFQAARLSSGALQWSGINEKKAIWLGSLNSMVFLSAIEVMDGLSDGWGFSTGDMISNTLGCALYTSQALLWKEQKFSLKFSYHFTEYAKYRPEVLGDSPEVRLLKDYNGHTYWLSGNLKSLLKGSSRLPSWLNLAVGYGANGMMGANTNTVIQNDGRSIGFARYRQFYLSPDIDFTRIQVKSKLLKTFLSLLNCIKIPFPAIEYNTKQGVRLRPLVF